MPCSWASPVQVHSSQVGLTCIWGAPLKCEVHLHVGCTPTERASVWGTFTRAAGLAHGAHSHVGHAAHVWRMLIHGMRCQHVERGHAWGALLTHRAHSHVRRTACAWSRLTPGVHRWRTLADVPPHETVTALRVAKRQCPALGVRSASEDEKFPPNVLIHSACRYAHGN